MPALCLGSAGGTGDFQGAHHGGCGCNGQERPLRGGAYGPPSDRESAPCRGEGSQEARKVWVKNRNTHNRPTPRLTGKGKSIGYPSTDWEAREEVMEDGACPDPAQEGATWGRVWRWGPHSAPAPTHALRWHRDWMQMRRRRRSRGRGGPRLGCSASTAGGGRRVVRAGGGPRTLGQTPHRPRPHRRAAWRRARRSQRLAPCTGRWSGSGRGRGGRHPGRRAAGRTEVSLGPPAAPCPRPAPRPRLTR